MKTTLDLPDALVRQVKLRALQERKKLKDAVAELLRKGLAVTADEEAVSPSPVVAKDKETGLPLVQCKHAALPEDLTPDRVAEILLAQEVEGYHAASR